MAYNVKIDEACKYSVIGENMIDIENVPESLRNSTADNAGMIFYEIKIGCNAFKPSIDFSKWDPTIVKEEIRSFNIGRNATPEQARTTTTNTTTTIIDKQQQKRIVLSRKQIMVNKKNKKNAKKNKYCNKSHAMRARSYFSLESGITVIDKKNYCLLSNRFYDGDYYVLLMTHPLDGKKTDTNISYNTDPILEIFLHNNLLINDRSTSAAAPYWGADAILGPFASLGRSMECSEGIVQNTRGDVSKRNKCIKLQKQYDVNLYLSTITDKITTYSEYVHNNTPPSYIKAYQDRYGMRSKRRRRR